jgi:hypothetical protein
VRRADGHDRALIIALDIYVAIGLRTRSRALKRPASRPEVQIALIPTVL